MGTMKVEAKFIQDTRRITNIKKRITNWTEKRTRVMQHRVSHNTVTDYQKIQKELVGAEREFEKAISEGKGIALTLTISGAPELVIKMKLVLEQYGSNYKVESITGSKEKIPYASCFRVQDFSQHKAKEGHINSIVIESSLHEHSAIKVPPFLLLVEQPYIDGPPRVKVFMQSRGLTDPGFTSCQF